MNFDNKSCSPVPVPSVMSKNILKPDGLKALTYEQDTPATTLSISGLKYRVLKLTFLT